MESCQPHFIRCVKPNESKEPNNFNAEYVNRQLMYTGMLQTVQVRRDGYSHRLPFKDFWDRYRGLAFYFTDDKKMYAKNNDPKYNHAAQFRVAGNPKVLDLWLGLDCLIV